MPGADFARQAGWPASLETKKGEPAGPPSLSRWPRGMASPAIGRMLPNQRLATAAASNIDTFTVAPAFTLTLLATTTSLPSRMNSAFRL
jgi:hypothetical protein